MVHLRPPQSGFEPGRTEDEGCQHSPCYVRLSNKSRNLGSQDACSPDVAEGATKTQGRLVPRAQLASLTNLTQEVVTFHQKTHYSLQVAMTSHKTGPLWKFDVIFENLCPYFEMNRGF